MKCPPLLSKYLRLCFGQSEAGEIRRSRVVASGREVPESVRAVANSAVTQKRIMRGTMKEAERNIARFAFETESKPESPTTSTWPSIRCHGSTERSRCRSSFFIQTAWPVDQSSDSHQRNVSPRGVQPCRGTLTAQKMSISIIWRNMNRDSCLMILPRLSAWTKQSVGSQKKREQQ